MLLRLSPELSKHTNGISEHEAPGATIKECVDALFNRFPQFLIHMTANEGEVTKKTAAKLNGEYLSDPESYKREVADEDILELTQEIPNGEKDVLGYILAVVQI